MVQLSAWLTLICKDGLQASMSRHHSLRISILETICGIDLCSRHLPNAIVWIAPTCSRRA